MRVRRRLLTRCVLAAIALATVLLWTLRPEILEDEIGRWKFLWGNFSPRLDEDCRRILEGDKETILAAIRSSRLQKLPSDFLTDEQFSTLSCHQLLQDFWTRGVSELETHFPIAFSILVYKDFYQFRLLLQAVHRSHNSYCVHIDSEASEHLKTAVRRLAGCLGNVRVKESEVEWGTFSVLEAEMLCFHELLHNNRTWKYVINLTAQEFPIRTLKEMTEILILMNGSNHVEKRDTKKYFFSYPAIKDARLTGLRWYKGSVHAVLSRPAVRYMLQDDRARIIYEHIRRHFWGLFSYSMTYPDETFFATLNHNYKVLGFPGSYTGREFMTGAQQIFRYKLWYGGCLSGLRVRLICILGVADLPYLNEAPHLIANKFHFNHEREALRCARARFWANTEADYRSDLYRKTADLPMQFYRRLEFLQHHT